jgi:hypothetical protein
VEHRAEGMSEVLQEGTDQHAADTARRIEAAQRSGLLPEDQDAMLLALGVVGAVGHFTHWHRSGRIVLDVDELAAFVGTWVIRAVAGEVPAPVVVGR